MLQASLQFFWKTLLSHSVVLGTIAKHSVDSHWAPASTHSVALQDQTDEDVIHTLTPGSPQELHTLISRAPILKQQDKWLLFSCASQLRGTKINSTLLVTWVKLKNQWAQNSFSQVSYLLVWKWFLKKTPNKHIFSFFFVRLNLTSTFRVYVTIKGSYLPSISIFWSGISNSMTFMLDSFQDPLNILEK